jgi:hypothetical protein
LVALATGFTYFENIFFDIEEPWLLPAGAYGESCGPM